MRIAYILKRYPRYSETFIVNEILAHEAAGVEVEIFALRPPSDTHFQDAIANVRAPVHYVAYEAPKATKFWEELRGAGETLPGVRESMDEALLEDAVAVRQALLVAHQLRARDIDHIHAHFGTVATTVSRLAGRFAGLPYSFTAHAKDIFHESVDNDHLARKLSDAAAVITVSEFNLAFLRETHAEAADRVIRVYNGLDLERFAYEAPDPRPPLVLGVGRLVEKKGFNHLIEACRILSERGRGFACRIIGAGEREADLVDQIRKSGLDDEVELTGPLPQREIIQQIRSSAVMAAPCIVGEDGNRDGLPTTLLEAMALGTPCISTDVTGIPEVVRDGVTGLMVPQNDAKALADAIEGLLWDAERRVRLAAEARRLIEREFDIHKNTARLRAAFAAARAGGARISRAS